MDIVIHHVIGVFGRILDLGVLQADNSVTLSSSFWPVDNHCPILGIRVGD